MLQRWKDYLTNRVYATISQYTISYQIKQVIYCKNYKSDAHEYWVCRLVCFLFQINNRDLTVSFITNEEIKRLNSQYRHKDQATDILSFPTYTVLCNLIK